MSKEHEIFLKNIRRQKSLIRFFRILIFILFFTLWEFLAIKKIIDPFIFSHPSAMVNSLIEMIINRTIFRHVFVTLTETIIGFISATLLGTIIAVILWWNTFLNRVFDPYLVAINSLPKTALAPIIIVWLGNSIKAIIAVAILTSIVVTIINVLGGFYNADEDDIKLIKSFGGTKKDVLLKVVFPKAVPEIIDALKINVGLSLVGVIVGEFLTAKEGLGYLIVYGSQIFKLDWVMLSVIILAIISSLLYKIIQIVEKFVLKRTGL